MDEANLLLHYNQLVVENAKLKNEVARLHQLLDQNNICSESCTPNRKLSSAISSVVDIQPTENRDIPSCSLHHCSSNADKISFFMELFAGRKDVYARRWYSTSSGKSGYSPVCKNEWVPAVCDKRKNKCTKCPHRVLEPLSSDVIDKHLRGRDEYGRDVIGIYPLLADETTTFLAVDFDENEWQKDVAAFRQTCFEIGIFIAVERSRSGNGAHAWCFFQNPISAILARKLGNLLLTQTMNRRHEICFSSYDRLFPNQDRMPSGGFGNLIALPLQGQSRRKGNSVFIDENFQPYVDQWSFLAGIKKLTSIEVQRFIDVLLPAGELGVLADPSEAPGKPWEKKPEPIPLTSLDFPEIARIVQGSGLYINKTGFSQRALNRIKRLAAFRNPDFYKSIAMRLPVWDKPRIISTATETSEYLVLPRGCLDSLEELLQGHQTEFELIDHRQNGRPLQLVFNGQLQAEQQCAADSLLLHENGVLSATTAFGKTVVGAFLMAMRGVNTLVLVHSTALLSQWKDSLEHFLSDNDTLQKKISDANEHKKQHSFIGQLGGGKKTLTGRVDIAVMQSLTEGDEVKELVKDYGMVLVDECHHVPAVTFERILAAVSARYVYGLTATPVRQDGHQPIIFMQCGPVRCKIDAKEQAAKRTFEHFVIHRFTRFRLQNPDDDNYHITDIYKELFNNSERNEMILDDVVKLVKKEHRNVIVLTERTAHADRLTFELQKVIKHVIELTGVAGPAERARRLSQLQVIPIDEPLVLVATGKYIGEGFDLPRLDTLLLTMPISWKGTLAQYVGRLHREYKGKKEVRVYDYVDIHVKMLDHMYQKRIRGYNELGYQLKLDDDGTDKVGVIFDNNSFLSVFNENIFAAQREIVIVCPYLRRSKTVYFINQFLPALERGVRITVVTRPPENYRPADSQVEQLIQMLRQVNIHVKTMFGIHQKFAVFDANVVWYGSINFLAYGSSEETVMRFENRELAEELLAAMEFDPDDNSTPGT